MLKHHQQKAQHDRRAKPRVFRVGDTVFVKNFGAGRRWLLGQIIEITGPVSFHVLLEDGRPKRCHQDQLRPRVVDERDAPPPPPPSQGDPDPSFPISDPTSSEETPPAPQDVGPPEPPQQTDSSTSPSSDANTNDRSTDRPTDAIRNHGEDQGNGSNLELVENSMLPFFGV